MALQVGSRLAHYDVTALIGEGGMGQVYQATDTKLKRQVALKILPEAFSADPERLARFQREAEVLASLNHPNIAAIHGLEEAEGTRALVLELVEGPTLADRIKRGPIPLDAALPIAKQIAEALEAEHEAGVIHRDLKPANIKVRDDGTVKVLDFGLAKAFQPDANDPNLSQSPTISLTAAATQMGMVIGTAAYMAPEQAKGKVVDKRVDVWAFGAVLFEMLSGKKPFVGDDVSDTLALVLKFEPDWDALPSNLPQVLATYLRRCLEKEPKQRVHDIADVRLAMEGAFETVVHSPSERVLTPTLSVWQRPVTSAVAVLAALAVGGLAVWSQTRPAPRPVARTMLTVPPGEPLRLNSPDTDVAISPDGTHVVYAGTGDGQPQLYVRALDELDPTALTGLGTQPRNPFISPDGNWVGFFDGPRALQRVSIRGGPPVPIAEVDSPPRGASWGTDDTIVFATGDPTTGLWQVASGGGEPELLTTPDPERGERDHLWPEILPGGQAVLFTIRPQGSIENAQIAVLSLESRTWEVVLPGGSHARYVPTGHLVYGVRGTLQAVGFDLDRLEVTSDPVPVVDTVNMKPTGAANFGVAQNGSLVYIRGDWASGGRALVWVDRDGNEEPLAAPAGMYDSPRISPDGTRVALMVLEDSGIFDIHIYDIARNNVTQLTFTAEPECCPVWMPDGKRLVFTSARDGTPNLYMRNADGTGEAARLTEGAGAHYSHDITAKGTTVVFESQGDLHTLSLDGEPTASPLVQTEFDEGRARLSPDGRWIAYQTSESGEFEVLVRPFPEIDDGRSEATTDGGHTPVWSPDGRELFFFSQGAMWVVPIETEPTFRPLTPERLFPGALRRRIRRAGFAL